MGVNTGKAYSDEYKLLMPMLKTLKVRARYFLGDAYYGKVKVLKDIKRLKMKPIVPIGDTREGKALGFSLYNLILLFKLFFSPFFPFTYIFFKHPLVLTQIDDSR